jgi:uncharacterized protein YkwD
MRALVVGCLTALVMSILSPASGVTVTRSSYVATQGVVRVQATQVAQGGDAQARLPARLKRVLELVNAARAKRDLKPMKLGVCLTNKAAQPWARHMADTENMVHQDLSPIFDKCPGFSRLGENIAYGYPTARAVMRAWMKSKGHRKNILKPKFRKIGLGLARADDGTPYWVQDFGG